MVLGDQSYTLLTTKCACAFPNEKEYPVRFPILAVLPQTKDLYEPEDEEMSLAMEKEWRSYRKDKSKSFEQIAVLVAMAQFQAFTCMGPSQLKDFEVCCLSKYLLRHF